MAGEFWYVSTRHSTAALCEICASPGEHARWCITVNGPVLYAFDLIDQPEKMTIFDRLTLRAARISWL